jgi:hypothetical protein
MSTNCGTGFTTQSLAGSAPSAQIRVTHRDGSTYYITPPPQIGWSSQEIYQGNHSLGTETTVTLNCFSTCNENITLSGAGAFFGKAEKLEVLDSQSSAQPAITFNIINPRVSVEPSSFTGVTRFTVEFTDFSPGGATSGSVTSVLHGEVGTEQQSIPLSSFSDVFTYEPDESLGRVYDDPSAQVYRFTRTCSAKGRPATGADINRSTTFQQNACSGVKAFVDARMSVNQFAPYYVTPHFEYIKGATVFNMAYSSNIDLGELSYSVTINGLMANTGGTIQQLGAFETTNVTVQQEANSRDVSVTVDGKLTGYATGATTDPRISIKSGSAAGAQSVLNRISGNGNYGYGTVIYKRAQGACATTLNAVPQSISISDSSDADGSMSYNVTYNNRPSNSIPGSITENISVSDSYPTDVYASIQIMGKRDGPVFQYMNTTSEYKRTLSVEAVMGRNITASPSVHSTTRNSINNLISGSTPSASSAGYVMVDSATEEWNSREGRYSLNITWSYK